MDFTTAPQDLIDRHPDVLAELIRVGFGLEPEDYALSDESILWDMAPEEEDMTESIQAINRHFGLALTLVDIHRCIWQIVDQIVLARR